MSALRFLWRKAIAKIGYFCFRKPFLWKFLSQVARTTLPLPYHCPIPSSLLLSLFLLSSYPRPRFHAVFAQWPQMFPSPSARLPSPTTRLSLAYQRPTNRLWNRVEFSGWFRLTVFRFATVPSWHPELHKFRLRKITVGLYLDYTWIILGLYLDYTSCSLVDATSNHHRRKVAAAICFPLGRSRGRIRDEGKG